MDKYLVILVDSLEKKNSLLDEISRNLDEQELCLTHDPFSLEEIVELMDKKGELIEKMNQLDDGFTALYARVSPVLKENPSEYREKVLQLQHLISRVSDKIALIQAREIRIHNNVEKILVSYKPAATRSVNKAEVAQRYYKTMKKATLPQSIFMNKKN